DVLAPAREQRDDGEEVPAATDECAAEVRAQEPGATRDDGAGHQRPRPSYAKPRLRMAAGSRRLRASTMRRARISSPTRSKSSHRNSSHSVSTTTTSASA